MTNLRERLERCRETGTIDPGLLAETISMLGELRQRNDLLERLLIMIVRTGWPWDGDGEPNDMLRACRDGYAPAMIEAKELLGLDHLSTITRTEPRT